MDASLLDAAWARRAALDADPETTAYRLFHGHGEGAPGITVDRWGAGWVLTVPAAQLEDALALISGSPAMPQWIVAREADTDAVPRVVRGHLDPGAVVVEEGGLKFEVEPLAARSAGLYLDARPARTWLRASSAGRLVLNLFAYTGSLGIAAAAGGARGVTHLEMQKRALRRIRRNLALNGLPVDDRDLVAGDLYAHLRRLGKSARRFGGVILDPPPIVPAHGGRQPRGQDYEALIPLATRVLADDGWLLCFFSRRDRAWDAEEARVIAAADGGLEVFHRMTSGEDFPEAQTDARLRISALRRTGGPV